MADRPPKPATTLLTASERLQAPRSADDQLVLPFELRSRSRFRARLARGEEVGVLLPRGQVLRGGDLLRASDGRVIGIAAALESVSIVHSSDASALARAAYHLGNRHIALQIGSGWLRYLHDHVLDDMLRGLGLQVRPEQAAFEPESGAYSGSSDAGTHGHAHTELPAHPHTQDPGQPGHSHE